MTSGEFKTLHGQSDLDGPTTVPAVWSASDSEHSALHKPSDAVKWEPALRPQDRRNLWVFVSVVLQAVAVITFAVMLAMRP